MLSGAAEGDLGAEGGSGGSCEGVEGGGEGDGEEAGEGKGPGETPRRVPGPQWSRQHRPHRCVYLNGPVNTDLTGVYTSMVRLTETSHVYIP